MNISLIATSQLITIILIVIAILFILVLILVISYRRSTKFLYKKHTKTYEYNHNLLNGEITRIIKRLQIISSNNTSYLDKYTLLNKYYQVALSKDKTLEVVIKKFKTSFEAKNYHEFKSVLKENNSDLNKFNKTISYLYNELVQVIKTEEEYRRQEAALFESFKEIKDNYNKKSHNYEYVAESFNKLFESIEHQFVKIDEYLDYADYEEVEYALALIKSTLIDLPNIAKELPEIIERATRAIPSKIKNLERKYEELIAKEFPLSYLNIEATIEVMRNTLKDIDNKIKDLDIKGINQILDKIETKVEDLINTLIEEEKAKAEFDEIYSSIIVNVNKTDSEYAAVKSNIEKFEKIYLMDKDHESKLAELKALVDKMDIDKRNIELQIHYNGLTPYSYLINVAKGLDENAKKTSELLVEIKSYQLSCKEICEEAYDLLEPTYHKVKLYESKLNSLLQPNIEEKYKMSIERSYIILENVNRAINTMPIDVKLVETLTEELSSLYEKEFLDIETTLEYQQKAQDAIVYINRERMNYSDINSLVVQAENHYNRGEYKLAYDLTVFILENLNKRVRKFKKVKKIK